jgi:hypothetical protein
VAFEAEFMGNKMEYSYESAEYIPGEKLVVKPPPSVRHADEIQVLRHAGRWDQDGAVDLAHDPAMASAIEEANPRTLLD